MAAGKRVVVAEVVRMGDKITLPENASIPEIIDVLQKEHAKEEQRVTTKATVNVPPWDGALALQKALEQVLGFALQTSDMWTDAAEMDVEIGYGQTMQVKWGIFKLPGMGADAIAATGTSYDADSGRWVFQCTIQCKGKFKPRAQQILDTMRHLALTESLHKGKAFSLRYYDDDGDKISMPMPKFFPLTQETPIYRRDLELSIERNIFTPIRKSAEWRAMGKSLKRGILLVGPYGTGKTLLISYVARVATENGYTCIYVKEPAELKYALKEAQRLQPCVIISEDVDRIAGPERTDDVNKLLNQLDGIDSKASEIITILTSNHGGNINKAMRRPGRIDVVLQVLPPDAEAVDRMVREFAGKMLEENADLTGITTTLAGFAPAYIREAVERAQMESLRRTGKAFSPINGDDLTLVAKEVVAENLLFREEAKDTNRVKVVAEGFQAMSEILDEASATLGHKPDGMVPVVGHA